MNPPSERRFPRLPLVPADAGASPGVRVLRAKGPFLLQPQRASAASTAPWSACIAPFLLQPQSGSRIQAQSNALGLSYLPFSGLHDRRQLLILPPMSPWFYSENNQQAGPVTDAELHALVVAGRVLPTTLVWRDGMPKWLEFSQLSSVGSAGMLPSPYNEGVYYPATSGFAIASMIVGIIGLVSCLVFLGLPAVVLGHVAMNQINNAPRMIAGRGMAITGLVCGYLGILLMGGFLIPFFFGIAMAF